ncbi:hypothetical protein BJ878DRAFT_203950 [Calycina marina]|uniref:Uncharacterized protein n=1 Tax=Calycina marina TaxID=1763456 RepID=A0A9P7YY83_9HELO|nr:hypothetical protein BJ878DRAFT_203950 [Calycina marina]
MKCDANMIGSDISIYQAGLRRQHLHVLVQIGLLISFHIGLPSMSMVQGIESDIARPTNLRDEHCGRNSTE